jgi:hypothetical protein
MSGVPKSFRDRDMIASALASLEALAFSAVLPASVAGALVMAAGFSLVGEALYFSAGMAFAGTLVVYNVDRLRDLERDRRASPRRSEFVSRHRHMLVGLVALGSAGAAVLGWRAGPATALLCASVLLPALLHRRIKHHPDAKALYVTAAWVTVTVGLPGIRALQVRVPDALASELSLVGDVGGRIALIACIYAAAIGANLIASNVREDGDQTAGRRAVWRARGLAAIGVLIAIAAPPPLGALGWIPLAQLAGLIAFRVEERTRLIVVDGCLLLGALAALAQETLR